MEEELIELEATLVMMFEPSFLTVYKDANSNYVVIMSTYQFNNTDVQSRVKSVYYVIKEYHPEFYKNNVILLKCLNDFEMIDILETNDVYNEEI